MLEYGIILFFEQAKTSSAFKPIGDEDPNYNIHDKISGTIAKFILDNLEQAIWISPDIVKFAENGFVTEEISIANK